MNLTSRAFSEGATIPVPYTCDGTDSSPPLAWTNVPAGTKAFALICDDPDAPGKTFVHWVLYNLPGTAREVAENHSGGALEGMTDFRRTGWGGPCPPPGTPHRYFFRLYALDATLSLAAGATKSDVERAIQGHVVGEAQLMGRYGRTR